MRSAASTGPLPPARDRLVGPGGRNGPYPSTVTGLRGSFMEGHRVERSPHHLVLDFADRCISRPGCFHLATRRAPFLLITPDWVPFPRGVILVTGLCELAGSVGLLTRSVPLCGRGRRSRCMRCVSTRPTSSTRSTGCRRGRCSLGWWYHAPRLALQPVLVWWALFAGERGITGHSPPAGRGQLLK